ncbi:MAG: histidine--tRNA ligase [Planctomycetota bacterium]
MEKIALPAGFEDILPEQLAPWAFAEQTIRTLFGRFGFAEIRTPHIEHTALFVRGIGEGTDIVDKEMYTFGTGADAVSLRPEGTAPVIRSYLENGGDKFNPFRKYWYMGPMFRHERPQKGRKRQFVQAGVEMLGTASPAADAETVVLAHRLLQALRVSKFNLKINTTGCAPCKDTYRAVLRDALKPRLERLCGNCQRRFTTNIFRVLDCKVPSCREAFDDLPDILTILCAPCREHHDAFKGHLFDLKIEFEEDRFLVRGLDYYTRTVFEVTHGGLGAQDALLGGGRYDNLVVEMGGQLQPSVGFAAGLDRIIAVMEPASAAPAREGIYIATMGPAAFKAGYKLAQELRDNGIKADVDFEGRSLKAQMKAADRRQFRLAAMLGEDELAKGSVTFRDLNGGDQVEMPLEGIAGRIAQLLKEVDENLKRALQDGEVR